MKGRRRYVAGVVTVALAAAVAMLVFGGAAGAKPTRGGAGQHCAKPSKIKPTKGGPGTRITVYGSRMNVVTSMWLKRKSENGLFDAKLTDLMWGDGWVSGVVPAGVKPMIVDGPVELDALDTGLCVAFTEQIFHIEGYK